MKKNVRRPILIYFLGVFLVLSLYLYLFPEEKSIIKEKSEMNDMIQLLKNNGIDYYAFTTDFKNGFIVVPKFGARIMGIFINGKNYLWNPPDILKAQGGQRTWMGPEGGDKGFIFRPDWKGNRDFSMLDPGNYELVSYEENKFSSLQNTFKTTSNDGIEDYHFTITREMKATENPLKDDPEFRKSDLKFSGVDFTHKLKNNGEKTLDRIVGLWCLTNITPQGTMIIPVNDVTEKAYRGNYFEPLPVEYVKANSDSFSFFIHGSRRYKVGIRPQSAKGAVCYLSKTEDGKYYIVMMKFPVYPDDRYADKPRTEQHTNGDAIQIYSHLEKPPFAFGELECHSPSFYLPSGKEESFNIKLYVYSGSLDWILKVGKKLVCPDFNKAYLFVK